MTGLRLSRSWGAVLGILGSVAGAVLVVLPAAADPPKADPPKAGGAAIDFNRQIRPILSDACFACHGPDQKKRKAELRLDLKSEAQAFPGLIAPGKPEESELIKRLTSEEGRMPPAKSGKKLTAQQIALLREWVKQGAAYADHWAFVPPRKPAVPQAPGRPAGPVDAFIAARLRAEGLALSPPADKAALIRRVSLDLTGLPPSVAEVDAFLADPSPAAYEKVVDRLLRSPRYGEHMARHWLDAARYGDTHGLHLDNYREIWPYRDWVIRAFNANMPFDRFVVEQLAGDLLPGATQEQVVATGFNRCHVTTSEGGSIDEEVYVRNVTDQVDTNGTVFLGLTMGCARCHEHKYDPFTMKDYYSLFAFFNSIDGAPLDGNAAAYPPVVKVASGDQAKALAELDGKLAGARQAIADAARKAAYDPTKDKDREEQAKAGDFVWIDDGLPAGARAEVGGPNLPWTFVGPPEGPVQSGGKAVRLAASGLQQVVLVEAKPGLRVGEGDVLFTHVFIDPKNPPKEVMLQWFSDAWRHRAYWGENRIDWGKDNSPERLPLGPLPRAGGWVRLEVPAARVGLNPGMTVSGWAFTQHDGLAYWDRAGLVTKTPQADGPFETMAAWLRVQKATGGAGLPGDVQAVVKADKRTPEQETRLRDYFVINAFARTRETFAPLQQKVADLQKQKEDLDRKVPVSLVFKERTQPREAFILKRGEYDQRGEKVARGVPALLAPFPKGAPLDRLGFARWLVQPGHPLTARVAVNRYWQQMFGTGLVKTAEDFGSQGEPPSHPELLDWLAVQFVEDGWDVKALLKRLVMSDTYRQSVKVTPERLARDPANRLLSRAPRYRLDAEVLRDQALCVGGLLVEKQGGPSVKPPQPSGLWEAVGYTGSNTAQFTADTGLDKVHRRSLYTFWKRTSAPPQMTTFDAPSRESCTPRRERTNTPLQALLLLNETQVVEASRALAERAMKAAATPEERVAAMFRRATARAPEAGELAELVKAYRDNLAVFGKDPEAAKKLIAVGESKADGSLAPAELAALTLVGNVILNLDEVVTKG